MENSKSRHDRKRRTETYLRREAMLKDELKRRDREIAKVGCMLAVDAQRLIVACMGPLAYALSERGHTNESFDEPQPTDSDQASGAR